MQAIRPMGREAGARKYDMLSALAAHGLAGDKHRQRLVLRLMALITSRYNWQRGELSVGQREIARLWAVDERTVKRDMARLREIGWIVVRRQGVRGRVSVLGLDLERIMLDTRGAWENVGPDFVERFGGPVGTAMTGQGAANVVPLRPVAVEGGRGVWGDICSRLAAEDKASFDSWFAGLRETPLREGCLTLIAPTRFHANYVRTHLLERIVVAARRMDAGIERVEVCAG